MFLFNFRYRTTIIKLNFELEELQIKMKNVSNSSIDEILDSNNFNEPQKLIIKEIINTSRATKPNNKRSSEDWILLCILLRIRSDD